MIRLAQRQSRSTWAAAAAGAGAGATRRGFAVAAESPTLADVHGVKCATSTSTGSRETAAISVVVKAGARHEPAPGVAHVLKNSLFKVSSVVVCWGGGRAGDVPICSPGDWQQHPPAPGIAQPSPLRSQHAVHSLTHL